MASQAATPASAGVSNQDLLDALAAAPPTTEVDLATTPPSKTFKPVLVQVREGVVYIVGRLGKTLLLVEGEASEVIGNGKVWVIAVAAGAKDRIAGCLEPATSKLHDILAPALEKADAAHMIVKSKILSVAVPIQVKIQNGVVHVRGVVDKTYVSLSAKVTTTWTSVTVQSSTAYGRASKAVSLRVQPVVVWSTAKASSVKNAVCHVAEPSLMRAKDGCLYVQSTIGNTVVRIKLGASDASNRVSALVLKTCASAKKGLSGYTTPMIEQMVAMYENINSRITALLGPYLEKLQGQASTFKAKFQGMIVAIKVRAASTRELAMSHTSMCYVKVKDNSAYVYGLVGEKVVYIKVSIKDLLAKLGDKVTKLNSKTKAQLMAAKDVLQAKAIEVSEVAKRAAGDLSSNLKVTVNDRGVQVTTAGAVGGATAMGATGGATGLAIGAACGVPAAFFTFGLSIPIGAMVGGTTGLVAGGSVGFVTGGVAARTAHKHHDDIRNGMVAMSDKANGYKLDMKEKAKDYKELMAEKTGDMRPLAMMRARLVGGTGGTA